MHKLHRVRFALRPHHIFWAEMMLSLFFGIIVFSPLTSAADVVRFTNRSLLMNLPNPGVLAEYTLKFTYNSETTIGSVDLLFCTSPIPDDPCHAPLGLDVSQASLVDQLGEAGYSLDIRSPNHMVLTRSSAAVVAKTPSAYVFHNVRNSTEPVRPFSIRISDYASTDATGSAIDIGSVVGGQNEGIMIETQVAPMLIFCLGRQVEANCSDVTGGNFSDFGDLATDSPLTAQSQMAVGTNASAGFVITVNGTTMLAGNSSIPAPSVPTASIPGTNQFGINLVSNDSPTVGSDPDGDSTNAIAATNYDQPNKYMFKSGDVVASAPNVSLIRRFTVSYIVNANENLKPGVYTTTLSYVCSGRF